VDNQVHHTFGTNHVVYVPSQLLQLWQSTAVLSRAEGNKGMFGDHSFSPKANDGPKIIRET